MALRKDAVAAGIFPGAVAALLGGAASNAALTALAGGGQTGATLLSQAQNVVSVCATGADSCMLPVAEQGDEVWVRNNGAASANVYPQVGGVIDGASANAARAVGASKTAIFKCLGGLTWLSVLTA